jgi:hypothetical protein
MEVDTPVSMWGDSVSDTHTGSGSGSGSGSGASGGPGEVAARFARMREATFDGVRISEDVRAGWQSNSASSASGSGESADACDRLFRVNRTASPAPASVVPPVSPYGDWLGLVPEMDALERELGVLKEACRELSETINTFFEPLESPLGLSVLVRTQTARTRQTLVAADIFKTRAAVTHTEDVSRIHVHARAGAMAARRIAAALIATTTRVADDARTWVHTTHAARRETAAHAVMVPRGARNPRTAHGGNAGGAAAVAAAREASKLRVSLESDMFCSPSEDPYAFVVLVGDCRAGVVDATESVRAVHMRLATLAATVYVKSDRRSAHICVRAERETLDEITAYLARRSAERWEVYAVEAAASAELARIVLSLEAAVEAMGAQATRNCLPGPVAAMNKAATEIAEAIAGVPANTMRYGMLLASSSLRPVYKEGFVPPATCA